MIEIRGQQQINTKLSMIVDPVEQSSDVAATRTESFILKGGNAVLIGGSGYIDEKSFENTVNQVSNVIQNKVPLYILPGDLRQVPQSGDGLAGLFNYKYIVGRGERLFNNPYPPFIRPIVARILKKRNIPNIETLYVLCGDPSSSVSKVSKISPLDFELNSDLDNFLKKTAKVLEEEDLGCVFLESGSGSSTPLRQSVVAEIRNLINRYSQRTLLFVSGGVNKPEQAGVYKGIADYVNVGSHFEKNGVSDVPNFIDELS